MHTSMNFKILSPVYMELCGLKQTLHMQPGILKGGNYWSGPDIIISFKKREAGELAEIKGRNDTRKGPPAKKYRQHLEANKGKETELPSPEEEARTTQTLFMRLTLDL